MKRIDVVHSKNDKSTYDIMQNYSIENRTEQVLFFLREKMMTYISLSNFHVIKILHLADLLFPFKRIAVNRE